MYLAQFLSIMRDQGFQRLKTSINTLHSTSFIAVCNLSSYFFLRFEMTIRTEKTNQYQTDITAFSCFFTGKMFCTLIVNRNREFKYLMTGFEFPGRLYNP